MFLHNEQSIIILKFILIVILIIKSKYINLNRYIKNIQNKN